MDNISLSQSKQYNKHGEDSNVTVQIVIKTHTTNNTDTDTDIDTDIDIDIDTDTDTNTTNTNTIYTYTVYEIAKKLGLYTLDGTPHCRFVGGVLAHINHKDNWDYCRWGVARCYATKKLVRQRLYSANTIEVVKGFCAAKLVKNQKTALQLGDRKRKYQVVYLKK